MKKWKSSHNWEGELTLFELGRGAAYPGHSTYSIFMNLQTTALCL